MRHLNNPAILFSGGADSTLIYYWYAMNNKTPFTLYVFDRWNKPVDKAISLYTELKLRFNDNKSTLEVLELPEMPTYEQVGYAIDILKDKHEVVVFSGNQYPADESIRPKFTQSLIDFSSMPEYVYCPLSALDKSQIIRLYYQYGIEDLLPKTHSCGSNKPTPCGECFNCREREWAYKQLGLTPEMGI